MSTLDPVPLGDVVVGMAARAAATDADRAPRIPSRIGAQRAPLPRTMRVAVLLRDRYTCQWCHATARGNGLLLEIDHIVPWSAGGADHPVNLRTLCEPCNQDRSNRVTEHDRRALPVSLRCRRCDPVTAEVAAAVAVFCLACRAPSTAPYLADLLVGGAVPDDGVPPLRAGDQDYPALDGLRPGAARLVGLLRDRADAQAVDCAWCGALAGQPCVGAGGRPLVRSAAHPVRLRRPS